MNRQTRKPSAFQTQPSSRGTRAPGPRGWPGLGSLPEMRRDVLGLMMRGRQSYGDVVRYKIGPWVVHLICHPDAIGHVFAHPDRYDKNTFASSKIRQVTGDGLLVSNGDSWTVQRKAIQPAFAQSRVDQYLGLVMDRTRAMLDRWMIASRSGTPIDIASEMMRLTYGIVEQALFSTETKQGLGEIEEAVTIAMAHAYAQIQNPLSLPAFIPTFANNRFRRAMQTLENRVDAIISEHRQGQGQRDLLRDLIDANTPTGCPHFDDQALRNQTITLLLAGHETTANSLTWLWYLLDQNPSASDRMHAEVRTLYDEGTLRKESLKSLEFTSMSLREAMRIYTPIWAIFRRATHDDTIEGYRISRGTMLIISPYVTHRHPEFWTDPERFDPLRFEADRLNSMHPYSYIPFGGGPRFCVGKNLARLEGLVIAAMISQRFRLRLAPGQEIRMDPGITLRCRGGLKMFVESRGTTR